MKRISSLVVSLLFAFVARGELGIHPTSCPLARQVPIPDACKITSTQRGWTQAKRCLDAIVSGFPDLFPGATIGYQTDVQALPQLYTKGSAGSGYEDGDNTHIVSLASVTKPLVYTGLVKLVQDHVDSAECTEGRPTCVFPDGYDTLLRTAIQRLDARNHTDDATRWFTSRYTDDATNQTAWQNKIRIRHIAQMTSGYPTLIFEGYKFCDGPNCQTPNDIVCPTNPTDPECSYAKLYHQYLERRGTGQSAIPDSCRPRPSTGPRLFDFDTYYGGNVFDAGRLQQRFWRRYAFEPGLYAECIMTEDPGTGVGTWKDGREVTASDIARFYLGLPLQHEPGTDTRYAQANLYIAAYLIEALSRIPFNAYVKREIFAPVGMTDTFFVPDRSRQRYAPGGDLHYVVHGSTDPNNHSNDEGGTALQFARIRDIKRVPLSPARVVPDVAAPLVQAKTHGPDLNWDESRNSWINNWPEGGGISTATDMLKFLRFIRTGLAANGSRIFRPAYLNYMTTVVDSHSGRTVAFNTTPGPNPDSKPILLGNGYFTTWIRRDPNRCVNFTILPQTMIELPHGDPARVQLCDVKYATLLTLRQYVEDMMQTIDSTCP